MSILYQTSYYITSDSGTLFLRDTGEISITPRPRAVSHFLTRAAAELIIERAREKYPLVRGFEVHETNLFKFTGWRQPT